MKYNVFCDSGAPFLYHQYARAHKSGRMMGAHLKNRKDDNYDWLNSPDYLEYRDKYVRYIKKHEHETTVYTNLDIVNHPEYTWENQKWFEAQGLHPLPVWHFGSDPKWLAKYIDAGYDYIGIGGMVPNPYKVLKPSLDAVFTQYICDKDGYPKVKIHGFAATSIPLMCRYPWYSVDSSTWIKTAAFGQIIVPRKRNGKWDYLNHPHKIEVSIKSPIRKTKAHFDHQPQSVKKYIYEYIEMHGFEMGLSAMQDGEEKVIKAGLRNDYKLRANLNMRYYVGLQNALPEWPWKFKPNITKTLWDL